MHSIKTKVKIVCILEMSQSIVYVLCERAKHSITIENAFFHFLFFFTIFYCPISIPQVDASAKKRFMFTNRKIRINT